MSTIQVGVDLPLNGRQPLNPPSTTLNWCNGLTALPHPWMSSALLESSTSCITFSTSGEIQKHLFPDISGIVSFENQSRDWVVQGTGVIVTALGLPHPDASDFEILDRIHNLPVVYAVRIIRT